jgi:hypothetical protein
MKPRAALVALGVFGLGTFAGIGLKSVLAGGIPDATPLYYSGTLTENGQLVNGQRAITIIVWPDSTSTGTPLCQTVASTAQVAGGRFRIVRHESRCHERDGDVLVQRSLKVPMQRT